jgi:GTP-binding protein
VKLLATARFHISVARLPELPPNGAPEVCFAGRSNAGKSTAINILANQKRLAFSSKTPGRTRLINYFALRGPEPDIPSGFLVDLPGYGYAQISDTERAHWDQMLGTYVAERQALAGMVLIMDARRPFTDLDQQMVDWFAPRGRPMLMLLAKADKLNRSESVDALRKTRKSIADWGLENIASAQLFSALKRTGIEEAAATVEGWLQTPSFGA